MRKCNTRTGNPSTRAMSPKYRLRLNPCYTSANLKNYYGHTLCGTIWLGYAAHASPRYVVLLPCERGECCSRKIWEDWPLVVSSSAVHQSPNRKEMHCLLRSTPWQRFPPYQIPPSRRRYSFSSRPRYWRSSDARRCTHALLALEQRICPHRSSTEHIEKPTAYGAKAKNCEPLPSSL